mmetsp:Transcript_3116/g.9319  ORF Transcript_3116/g.9319 Transcript_3116/m.9319 type:complete len:207 (-) Transcript_3116:352-972(-)
MMSHLLAVLAIATTACGLVAPPRTPRTALVASPPTSRTSTALAAVAELAAAQVFGRLADKKLLLDVPGAGTPEMRDCCHGGCDNCDYSRVFDEMNAGLGPGRSHQNCFQDAFVRNVGSGNIPSTISATSKSFGRRVRSGKIPSTFRRRPSRRTSGSSRHEKSPRRGPRRRRGADAEIPWGFRGETRGDPTERSAPAQAKPSGSPAI